MEQEKQPNLSPEFLKLDHAIKNGNPEAVQFADFGAMSEIEKQDVLGRAFKAIKEQGQKEMAVKIFGNFNTKRLIEFITDLCQEAKGEDPLQLSSEDIKGVDSSIKERAIFLIFNFLKQFIVGIRVEKVDEHSQKVAFQVISPTGKDTIDLDFKL